MTIDNPGGRDKEKELENKLKGIDKRLSDIFQLKKTPIDHVVDSSMVTQKNTQKSNKTNRKFMKKRPSRKPRSKKPTHLTHSKRRSFKKGLLRVIPVGGLEEVGKNMMIFEYEKDILIVDMGFQFPTEDMLGVDYVLPDISYLLKKKKNIRGVVLTHGHLDHIGAIPYLLPKLGFPPVYGTPLTIGFVKKQMAEFDGLKAANLHMFNPKDQFRLGVFDVSFFRVNHSIPDAVAVVVNTPCGRIVHTGDFKFDFTPADQQPADYQEIAEVGRKGVALLVSDSTNATEPGHTPSEQRIADNLSRIIKDAKGRLIITSFSSLIGRLQQIMDTAAQMNRKIFLTGRSMENNIRIAQELGYIKVPKALIVPIRKMKKFRDEEVIILTTGSQGEDLSALARIATNNHSFVTLQKGDTVVLSSSPIIGNESAIIKVLNNLAARGVKVITNSEIDIHTSGHAKQEDLKLMIKLLKPDYLIPAHGDLYMRSAHKELAMVVGIPEDNVFLLDNGEVVAGNTKRKFKKTEDKIPSDYIMVEGPERSEVEGHILMDRQLMAENGVVTLLFKIHKKNWKLIGKPQVVSRGFVYEGFSDKLVDDVIKKAEESYQLYLKSHQKKVNEADFLAYIQHRIDQLLVRTLDKRPLVIPVVVYV